MEKGKGWHLESRRHSEARLYGRASGSKQLKAPTPKGTKKTFSPKYASKGNTLFYRLPNGKYVRVGSSWKIGAYRNIKKQFDKLDEKEAEKKLSEVKKITPVKETPAQIEADYNAVSKPEFKTFNYNNKEETEEYFLGKDPRKTKEYKRSKENDELNKREEERALQRQKEMQKEGIIKVPKEYGELIRVTLNRDLNYKFTYTSPGNYTIFTFSDSSERDKAYRDLQNYLYGNYNKDLRDKMQKESLKEEKDRLNFSNKAERGLDKYSMLSSKEMGEMQDKYEKSKNKNPRNPNNKND